MKFPLIAAVSFFVLTGCSAMSGSNLAENGSWAELGAMEGSMGSRERQNQFEGASSSDVVAYQAAYKKARMNYEFDQILDNLGGSSD